MLYYYDNDIVALSCNLLAVQHWLQFQSMASNLPVSGTLDTQMSLVLGNHARVSVDVPALALRALETDDVGSD